MSVIVLDHHTFYAWDGKKAKLESFVHTSHSFYRFRQMFRGTCLGYHSIAGPDAQRRDPNAESTASTPCRSVTRINLPRTPSASAPSNQRRKGRSVGMNSQIQLHPITNPVVLQRKLILERPLTLPLQHYLMRLSPNDRRNLCFE